MDFVGLLKVIIKKLESEQIPYMLVGSVASSYYGDPRLTRDIDLVVELYPEHILKFYQTFEVSEFYIPPEEVLRDEVLNRRSFNLIHHETGLKIDFMMRKVTAHAQEEFKRKQKLEILPGLNGYIATPEDVIIKKLQFYQEGGSQKHLTDSKSILSQVQIDFDYIERWIKTLRLEKEWRGLRN